MKIATQSDLDDFLARVITNPSIYPYMALSNYFQPMEVEKAMWNTAYFINDCGSCLAKISFDRPRNEMNISLWSESALSAGRAVKFLTEYVKRSGVRAINSVCHSSNAKSLNLHDRIYGGSWGCEKASAWNSRLGEYEDLYYFRKLICNSTLFSMV